ncbi:thioredoxin-disulfide reductase [Corynebacterium urealyticum]|uniref:Thioredoxin reductase n=1 Tax=Corynebacterium urealyticum TaxID=43771 RepID=A0A5D4FU61_9CORY|nr:thioredoxin-disulfide reductase [Corynebacterium urealyticum]TYR19677.1 thioredoxin-disulfide reductase [Corynebacterium urealyticum]
MSQPFLQANVGIGVNKAGDAADAATPADTPDTSASSGGTHDPAEKIHNVIIVGSGPAGYTAAIYAARAELEPIVFEGMDFGGLLMQTTEVENFPGFAKGIQGPELMDEMRNQAERFGADLRMEDVEKMDLTGEIKKVWADGEEYQARAVIIATGAAPRYLNIPGEQEMIGRGVSACATCDGFFFKDRKIAIVGGGDSAMEEADFLTKFGETVTLIHRRDEFRASKIMQERARQNPKIEFLMNSKVTAVHGENAVTSLTIEDTVTGESQEMEFDALFVAIGHDPRVSVFEGQVELKEDGYVKVDEPTTATSLPGVFAAGDLVDSHYQQAITAAGSGCRAALDAENYLAALPADEG